MLVGSLTLEGPAGLAGGNALIGTRRLHEIHQPRQVSPFRLVQTRGRGNLVPSDSHGIGRQRAHLKPVDNLDHPSKRLLDDVVHAVRVADP